MKSKLFFVAIFVLFTHINLNSQTIPIDKKDVPPTFDEVWTKEYNQSLSSIEAIIQTIDGYIWIGTNNGLFRYDGVRFTVFTSKNTPQLKNDIINALVEDNNATLWIGTGAGLVSYKEGKFYKHDYDKKLENVSISSMCTSPDGDLFLGSIGRGFIKISKDKHVTSYEDQIGTTSINAIYYSDNGVWILSYTKGLIRFENNQFEFMAKKNPIFLIPARIIYKDKAGYFWVGTTENGLIKFKDNHIKLYNKKNGFPSERILTINEDNHGAIWVGTAGGGLIKIKNDKFEIFTTKDGLNLDAIKSLLFDKEGSLWVGTAGGGLNKMKKKSIITYTMRHGLNDNYIWTINQDTKGNIWIGTGNNGINIIQKNSISSRTKANGLSSNNIRTILCDSKGRTWLGSTDSGIILIENKRKIFLTTYEGLANNNIRSIFEDSKGKIWIGSNYQMVIYSDRKIQKFTCYGTNLSGIRYTAEDNYGALWFASGSNGLYKYFNNELTHYTTKDGLATNDVVSLYFDKENTLWIATGSGLNRFKNNTFTKIIFNNPLDNQLILNIVADDYNNLWLSSFIGLLAVNLDELNSFADGKTSHINSRLFGKEDGMLSTECNGANQNAGRKTKDGRLWFPTMNGVVTVDPENIFKVDDLTQPNIVIDRFVVDDSIINLKNNIIEIEPGSYKFEFHYAALSYKDPNLNKYKYRLDGVDGTWIEAGNRAVAYYTNLPHGYYTFHVIASNADGIWNYTGKTVAFRILPRFFETALFISLSSIFVFISIIGIYRWRINNLRKAKINLENIVNGQTRQLQDELQERKNSESKLKESEEKLNFYIEGSKDGFWDWNIQEDKMSFNSNALHIFDCQFEELPKNSFEWSQKIHAEDRDNVQIIMDSCINAGSGYFEAEYRLLCNANKFKWVFDRGKIVEWDNNEKPILMAGSLTDITERKKNEEELLKSKKIESIGLLAGGIAHDFNNLLTAILGNISLIRVKLQKNDTNNLFRLLENSETASLRAKDLTQQLLTFSKGGQPIIKTIKIGKLLEECSIFTLRGSNVKSHFEIQPDLWFIDADEGQINQVIQNLVVNASQAMPAGGNMFISAKNVSIDQYQETKDNIPRGDYVWISIKDTGSGISEEHIDKIFDPYFTTKETGHGLGLSTSYSIVKKHLGYITVESKIEAGTTFIVCLPKSCNPDQTGYFDSEEIKHGKGKILVMDDEILIRRLLEEILMNIGYDVTTCENGETTINQFKLAFNQSNPYDLVILDLTIPGSMGGKEALQHLLEIDPKIKSIVTSGYSNDPVMANFNSYGFHGVITKPYKIEEISKTIYKVRGGN